MTALKGTLSGQKGWRAREGSQEVPEARGVWRLSGPSLPSLRKTVSLGRRPDPSRGCRGLGVAVSGDVPTPDLEITLLGLEGRGSARVSRWCITPRPVSRIFLPHNCPQTGTPAMRGTVLHLVRLCPWMP